jgi:sRNA-binding carbon storage regulator CsrA
MNLRCYHVGLVEEKPAIGRSLEPLLKVTVLEIKGGSVRLGFEGAVAVPVHRLEVWERIRSGDRPGSTPGGPGAPIM